MSVLKIIVLVVPGILSIQALAVPTNLYRNLCAKNQVIHCEECGGPGSSAAAKEAPAACWIYEVRPDCKKKDAEAIYAVDGFQTMRRIRVKVLSNNRGLNLNFLGAAKGDTAPAPHKKNERIALVRYNASAITLEFAGETSAIDTKKLPCSLEPLSKD